METKTEAEGRSLRRDQFRSDPVLAARRTSRKPRRAAKMHNRFILRDLELSNASTSAYLSSSWISGKRTAAEIIAQLLAFKVDAIRLSEPDTQPKGD